jgi:hypothetical protein
MVAASTEGNENHPFHLTDVVVFVSAAWTCIPRTRVKLIAGAAEACGTGEGVGEGVATGVGVGEGDGEGLGGCPQAIKPKSITVASKHFIRVI